MAVCFNDIQFDWGQFSGNRDRFKGIPKMKPSITLPQLLKVLNILLLIPSGGELICLSAAGLLPHAGFAHEVVMTLLLAFPLLAIVGSLCAVIGLFHIGTTGIPRILFVLPMNLALLFIGLMLIFSGTALESSWAFLPIICSPVTFFGIAFGLMFLAPNAKIIS